MRFFSKFFRLFVVCLFMNSGLFAQDSLINVVDSSFVYSGYSSSLFLDDSLVNSFSGNLSIDNLLFDSLSVGDSDLIYTNSIVFCGKNNDQYLKFVMSDTLSIECTKPIDSAAREFLDFLDIYFYSKIDSLEFELEKCKLSLDKSMKVMEAIIDIAEHE